MRYFIEFSYFGKAYHGWQVQPNAITVQRVLEEAFSTIMGQEISLVAAGRTDAGVHAKQMFAHFDSDEIENSDDLVFRLNSLLPEDIAVKCIFDVPHDSHARFNATERTYEYWLVQQKNPFYTDEAHYVNRSLAVDKMNDAATLMLSYSDFECFSKSKTEVHTYLCDLKKAEWRMVDDRLVFTITADRFLRNMVRAIVGTLLEVGLGKWNLDDVKNILESKNRSKAGASVPAKGLYLVAIKYPSKIINS
ncbi:tRNA pseudouridine(38-40) synthase TruA [Aurantibacter crassamenti]|uniref:tRNA pseudouridine(38-40) synthase TruA n=1 Tax=Aurantibacter crassamenti TaxID=1837375 RepID=UPI0019399D4E|nr:tRNA pseudouridine(38-40) synthase TruA [Aurantibacter crassamenti]MBM1106278.1 tRNA pseudouridine(38-40) synthase TruA [Aurantibacter crassamenti]